MTDVTTALNKINSQVLALREDVFGTTTSAPPNLKSAKDRVLAMEKQKSEGMFVKHDGSKTRGRTLSSASDDEITTRNSHVTPDGRQDSIRERFSSSASDPDLILAPEEVHVENIEKMSDNEECIIVDDENQKMQTFAEDSL